MNLGGYGGGRRYSNALIVRSINWRIGLITNRTVCIIGFEDVNFSKDNRIGTLVAAVMPRPASFEVLCSKYRRHNHRLARPQTHSHRTTNNMVALTCTTPFCVKYGLVNDVDSILDVSISCQ